MAETTRPTTRLRRPLAVVLAIVAPLAMLTVLAGGVAGQALVLVDRKGTVRYWHIGEGAYGETEATIRTLLAER